MVEPLAPVITLDGPSGSGKGAVGQLLARHLGWSFLDSGALYRLVALSALNHAVALDDAARLAELATYLNAKFTSDKVTLEGSDVSDILRSEECGNAASRIATLPAVRDALLARQRAFRTPPGLVADGRDMGSVVFPDAKLKIFLTASVLQRAGRRYRQLKDKGMSASMGDLIGEIDARDLRDATRCLAPMKPASEAVILDTSELTLANVVAIIIDYWRKV